MRVRLGDAGQPVRARMLEVWKKDRALGRTPFWKVLEDAVYDTEIQVVEHAGRTFDMKPPTLEDGYPVGWPRCPGCGKPALDGHITCGEVSCNEGGRR